MIGICDKGFIWNSSICDCECDKSWDFGEYLDYKIVNVKKDYLINWLKNVVKLLMEIICFIMQP